MCNSREQLALITRARNDERRGLVPIEIPLADPVDGLLTLENLQQPITATLVVWDEASVGDSYQLYWNDGPTRVLSFITAGQLPGDQLTLEIPAGLLINDGTYQVGYLATDIQGGNSNLSPNIPLIVDRTAPGGDLIAAMIFPVVAQDGVLTSAELTSLGNVLTAEIPGYSGMAWGDTIRAYWGSVTGPVHTVVPAEVNMDRVLMDFSRAFLESLRDVTEPAYFTVTDRAGNISRQSLSTTLRLFLQQIPEDFPAPLCTQADDGLIDDADARATVTVDIPQYPGSQARDKITLYWGDIAMPEAELAPGDEQQNPVFGLNVRYAVLAQAGEGEVALRYEVRRAGLLIGSSLQLSVTVNLTLPGPQDPDPSTPENENLALPVIKGTSANANNEDNVIDEDDFLLEAKAVIGWKDEFVVSDVINLFWGAQPAPVVFPIKSTDIGKDLLLTIPNTLISAEGTGEGIKIFYTVTHSGNPNTSKSAAQPIAVHSQGELPGGVSGLDGPVFANANENNAISPILSPDGTPIFVAPYENIDKYPRVTLVFHGYNAASGSNPVDGASVEETHVLDEYEMVDGYHFRVPDNKLRLICIGRAEAYYRVQGPNGPVNSKSTPVLIRMAIPGEGC